ncbi:MAG: hypothetical protein DBY39_03895 [Clostridiales bacterium]|nr:MAG: hypothetical protein DBY39_03895 [Clostridiales bacterium]
MTAGRQASPCRTEIFPFAFGQGENLGGTAEVAFRPNGWGERLFLWKGRAKVGKAGRGKGKKEQR